MKSIRIGLLLLIVASQGLAAPATPAGPRRGTTPQLIEQAVRTGELTRVQADVLLARSFTASVPDRYIGDRPADGTTVLLGLRRRLQAMPAGPDRAAVSAAVQQQVTPGRSICGTSVAPQVETLITEHFRIEFTGALMVAGVTIDDYAEALERAWSTEVDDFGWAAPPLPNGRYLVRIDPLLEPIYYGYVAAVAEVGDNPNTPWNDRDAYASCMVLQANYTGLFPSAPIDSMKATVGHEFNHSIQFGYGALIGNDAPQDVFVEGGASWMEDESFDEANDSYYYLWPDVTQPMGGNTDFPYSYWIVFRGMTERFGTNVAGGAEDVFQVFWEQVSKGTATDLDAMRAGFASKGLTLERAFHDYAIATAFVRPCGGGYVLPYCYEEAEGYREIANPPAAQAFVSPGTSVAPRARDNFSLHWTELVSQTQQTVTVTNTSDGGTLRAGVACDTGSAVTVTALPSTLGAGQSAAVAVDTAGCQRAVVVVSNETQTASSPRSSPQRTFTVASA